MTKAQYEVFVNDLHHLSLDIGLRPAARAMGVSEDRARKLASRRKWMISRIHPVGFTNKQRNIHQALAGTDAQTPHQASQSPKGTNGFEAKAKIMQQHSVRAQIGLAIAGTTAAEHLSQQEGKALCAPASAIAADQWSRSLDRVHGWSAARTQGAQVAVQVNIPLPTPEERAEMNALDRKLDAIAAKLKAD